MPFIVRAQIRIRNMHSTAVDFGPFDAEHDAYPALASVAGRVDCFGAQILLLINEQEKAPTAEPEADPPPPTPLHRVG